MFLNDSRGVLIFHNESINLILYDKYKRKACGA